MLASKLTLTKVWVYAPVLNHYFLPLPPFPGFIGLPLLSLGISFSPVSFKINQAIVF
jgi:hypothetical protein